MKIEMKKLDKFYKNKVNSAKLRKQSKLPEMM